MSDEDQKALDIMGKAAFGILLFAWLAFSLWVLHIDGKL